jgi:hypothetical protein
MYGGMFLLTYSFVYTLDSFIRIYLFKGVTWPPTFVNQTGAVPCPYNADGTHLERKCLWEKETSSARWENVSMNDICKKQVCLIK